MEQYSQAAFSTEESLFELQVDHEVSSHLKETAKWAKFLSIVGFIGCGFILILVVFVGSMSSSFGALNPATALAAGGLMQVVMLLAMVVLYFFPCLFMFNFSNKMLRAIRDNDQQSLIGSFRQLKLCYKYIGILTLVFISIYVVAILGAMIFAATR